MKNKPTNYGYGSIGEGYIFQLYEIAKSKFPNKITRKVLLGIAIAISVWLASRSFGG